MTDNMSQILFYGAAVGLLLILEAAVWRGFKSSAKRRSDSASDALTLNRIVYRDELNELNADLAFKLHLSNAAASEIGVKFV